MPLVQLPVQLKMMMKTLVLPTFVTILALIKVVRAHDSYDSTCQLAEELDQYCSLHYGKETNNLPTSKPDVNDDDAIDEIVAQKIASILFAPSCADINRELANIQNTTGGVFNIYPDTYKYGTEVYCDLETEGGGWTVVLRRMDGTVNFRRNWTDYVNGFGNSHGEFWMGLEKFYRLTSGGQFEIRVDIGDWEGNFYYAKYSLFSLGDASTKYQLNIGGYSGTAGDSLTYHNGMRFTTFDRDNDADSNVNCGDYYGSGWWFRACQNTNLNGKYIFGPQTQQDDQGIRWDTWKFLYSLKFAEMKFRPKA